ncbi:MAG: FHA domain-containing protein [Deltaproteobacteria bacterium]|nr:FHA domain-containing protein [Deltaproteobacteria bacterium]
MPKLILTFKKRVLKEYLLLNDSITIGREEDNGIVIDNPAVSSYHAKIDKVGPGYILTDLQSTNSTFVNNKRIVSHRLRHADNIIIGKHLILFVDAQKGESAEALIQKSSLDRTMMLDTTRQKELLAKQTGDTQAIRVPEKVGVISFIDHSGLDEIVLTKKLTKIGKAKTSEIRLSGLFMGATAATISKRPSGFRITFTQGLSKLRVNGQVITESTLLKDYDTIELGSYRFQFYQKETDAG